MFYGITKQICQLIFWQRLRNEYGRDPADVKHINDWHAKLKETIIALKRTGKSRVNEETVDVVCNAFNAEFGKQLIMPQVNL